MRFISTNGQFQASSFSDAILTGLCPDGGLLMPETLPHLNCDILASWKHLSYPSLLTQFLKYVIDKNDPIFDYLSDIENETFKYFDEGTIQIKKLKKFSVLELFHGPTMSFKDYAMFPLAFLIDKAIKIKSQRNNNVIVKQNLLIATTGDTGSSALEASRDFPETLNVFVLFPKDRITDTQRLQMTTSNTQNGYPIECSESCDELEEYIRTVNEDRQFCQRHNISCLNSINCGRIICQMALHLYAYLQTVENVTETVTIAIPCGGWGNLISACLVSSLGLPIQIVLCTNENDLGHRIIKEGVIEKQKDSYHTLSSAMDTNLPYNLVRLLWIFSGHDTNFSKSTMTKIELGEKVVIPESIIQKIRSLICDSHSSDDSEILKTMKKCYDEENYYICPHTATAASYFYSREANGNLNVALATASIEKFSEAGTKAGFINMFSNSVFLRELKEKSEVYSVMDHTEDPVPFLKKFIELRNN